MLHPQFGIFFGGCSSRLFTGRMPFLSANSIKAPAETLNVWNFTDINIKLDGYTHLCGGHLRNADAKCVILAFCHDRLAKTVKNKAQCIQFHNNIIIIPQCRVYKHTTAHYKLTKTLTLHVCTSYLFTGAVLNIKRHP